MYDKAILEQLAEKHFGKPVEKTTQLPASGSSRIYVRIAGNGFSCIGAYNTDTTENRLFIEYSGFFRNAGCPVPEIYTCDDSGEYYIQEDLGESMLLDVLEKEREGRKLSGHTMSLYKESLKQLLAMQSAGRNLDCSGAIPRPVFDKRCIMWDLNYFKYCFLKLAAVSADENALEDDFNRLTGEISSHPADTFMFRDFQSRNIMVCGDSVRFIDYQGGRKGTSEYDAASLLYDAIAEIPDSQRSELFEYYLSEAERVFPGRGEILRSGFHHTALVRLLQAMGAFGLRGLHENKQHFTDSILPGLKNIISLFNGKLPAGCYPEIEKSCRKALLVFSGN